MPPVTAQARSSLWIAYTSGSSSRPLGRISLSRFAWETFLLAETLGFPWVRLRPGLAIAGDRVGWATFLCGPPDPQDLLQAYVAVLDGEGLAR